MVGQDSAWRKSALFFVQMDESTRQLCTKQIIHLQWMTSLDNLSCSYGELLFRPEWKQKRLQILSRDNYTCQFCGATDKKALQVHHRQYHYISRLEKFKDPWDYPDECLITICKKCHDKGHSQYKVPKIAI